MAPTQNARHLFNEIPDGFPVPGKTTVNDTTQTIDLDTVPLNGGVLLKTLALSLDPYMRGRMREAKIKSYVPPFQLGEPLNNHGVATILRSDDAAFKAGDHVYGFMQFAEYQVVADTKSLLVLKNEEKLPWTAYLGVAGMPGKTAYYSWTEYSKAKKGETLFVSGGAGPVGSFVAQLAKQQGLKVIASAGSDAKVEFMKSIGVDVAFNYKTSSTREMLEKEGPIDVYFDNVGGETLEAALDAANHGARFIECGMISQYNHASDKKSSVTGIRNLFQIIGKTISMHGFLVGAMEAKYKDEFYSTVPKLVADGKIKYNEHLNQGLESTGQGILDVQTGGNEGKSIVVVAKD